MAVASSWSTSFIPHSRQITMPAPHHSFFYRPDAFPDAHPTNSVKGLKAITMYGDTNEFNVKMQKQVFNVWNSVTLLNSQLCEPTICSCLTPSTVCRDLSKYYRSPSGTLLVLIRTRQYTQKHSQSSNLYNISYYFTMVDTECWKQAQHQTRWH